MDNHDQLMKEKKDVEFKKYIDSSEFDHLDSELHNILTKICQNEDLEYVENNLHLLNNLIDKDTKINTCVQVAVAFSNSVKLIDMIIDYFKIDITEAIRLSKIFINCDHYNHYKYCHFINIACRYNPNVDIIKHLIEKYNIDILTLQHTNNDCLHDALYRICNLEIVRYLVEEQGMELNNAGSFMYSSNYFGMSVAATHNVNTAIYIFNKTKYVHQLNCFENYEYLLYFDNLTKVLVCSINCPIFYAGNYYCYFLKINTLLRKLVEATHDLYTRNDRFLELKDIVKSVINPLLLSPDNIVDFGFQDPYQMIFKEYSKLVDGLRCYIPIQLLERCSITYRTIGQINDQISDWNNVQTDRQDLVKNNQDLINTQYQTNDHIDQPAPHYTDRQSGDALFKCNNAIYYGSRSIVYRSMTFLTEIVDHCNFDELIELDGFDNHLPEYVVNNYIHASYTNRFNIDLIKYNDLMIFFRFIDRYPTTILSIDKFENQIIKMIETNRFNKENLLVIKSIAVRYKLKHLYLVIHNKLIYPFDK